MPSAVRFARGLFGEGASGARPSVEGHQPEPAASVPGGGPGGMGRGSAANIDGMDRQTLRDSVHRFRLESGSSPKRMATSMFSTIRSRNRLVTNRSTWMPG